MPKILNYGSLNLDYVYRVPHFVTPGETLSSTDRQIFAGGKGLNQSIAAAKAGANVYHAGAIGNDSELLRDTLNAAGVDCRYIKVRNGASGHTVIQVDASGQNCIILFKGANFSHSRAEMDAVLDNFAAGDYLLLQNEINDVPYLITAASRRGLKVCFNVSPYNEVIAQCDLRACHVLFVNEIEGAALTGLPVETDAQTQLSRLQQLYPSSIIVLTLGSNGALAAAPHEQVCFTPAFKVKAVDTTGAGDTFAGFFSASLSAGAPLQQALDLASAAAAVAVTQPGAAAAIPPLNTVQAFMAKRC